MAQGNPNDADEHPNRRADRNQPFIYVGDKDLKKLQKRAWDAGWWPKQKKNGIMWLAPDGVGHVTLHNTQSDHRAHDNAVSLFRNAGLDV